MYEIALVSSRKSRLMEKARFGSKGAKTALVLLEKPERILSAIQVGITMIGIVSGAYGGIALSEDLTPYLNKIEFISGYAATVSMILVVGLITYFSLILGELVPKTLALSYAESIAIIFSPVMAAFEKITAPVVWVLSISTKTVFKLFRVKHKEIAPVTEDELKILLKQGSDFGVIEKEESQIITEVFKFSEKKANVIMTPRINVVWLDINETLETTIETVIESGFSIFPVSDGVIENIRGIIFTKDILTLIQNKKTLMNENIISEPVYIPEHMSAIKVLETFRKTKKHFGIVLDEYGSIEGIITLHDIIENIIGDLPEFNDIQEEAVFKRDDGSFLVDGMIPLHDLKELLSIKSFYNGVKKEPEVTTLGGLMLTILERVPVTGDQFSLQGYMFEVVDMDGMRVDKVLIRKAER